MPAKKKSTVRKPVGDSGQRVSVPRPPAKTTKKKKS